MTNLTAIDSLKQWYTEKEIKQYFGARSEDDLEVLVANHRAWTSEERERFKSQLAGVSTQQRIFKRKFTRRGHSLIGTMLVKASHEAKR